MQFRNVESQKLIIEDEEQAKNLLSISGYSNLIKSYRQPYVYMDNDMVNFIDQFKNSEKDALAQKLLDNTSL